MPTKPPDLFDAEAEEAALGALLLDPAAYARVKPLITAADFHILQNTWLFEAIAALHERGEPVDELILADQLEHDGHLEAVGGIARIAHLLNAVPSALHVEQYARIVRSFAQRRRAQAIYSEAGAAVYDQNGRFSESLEAAEAEIAELRASMVPFSPITSAAQLLANREQLPADVVAGFIPGQAVVLLSGPGGDGKSYALLDLAVCVARGTPWLGLPVAKIPVLVVDLENHPIRMRERLREVLTAHSMIDEPPPVHLAFAVRSMLDSGAGVLELAGQVEKAGAGLVILDSLVDFLGDTDENSNAEMAIVAGRLREIVEKTRASLIAIHHTPKANSDTPRGATALRNGVDVCVMVSRDGYTFKMKQDKNRQGLERTITARLNWGDGTFNLSLIGESTGRRKPPPDPDEAAIIEVLEGEKWQPSNEVVAEVMKRTNHTRRTLQRKLRAMADDLVLEKRDQGPRQPYLVRLSEDEGDEDD